MKKSFKIALCGIITALSVVLLYLGSVIWFFVYIVPLLSGLLIIMVNNSLDTKSSVIVYFAVSVLSLFLLPDKECALLYVMFFGYYPIIKEHLERIKLKIVVFVVKELIFNTSIIIVQLICVYILNIPLDNDFGKMGVIILLLGANLVFVLYERFFGIFNTLYNVKIKLKLAKYLK